MVKWTVGDVDITLSLFADFVAEVFDLLLDTVKRRREYACKAAVAM